jgi:ribose 5-phosphate isomerase B
MKIYLGADHGGYKLKEEIKKWLKEWHMDSEDVGAFRFDSEDDYPDFAWALGQKVGSDAKSFGILACRSGQGECIVANKAKGVRAALCWNEKSAHAARNDDDANVLCLPADYVTVDLAKKIVHEFLTAKFDQTVERFARRLSKVKKIDINL